MKKILLALLSLCACASRSPSRDPARFLPEEVVALQCYTSKGASLEAQSPDKMSARNAHFLALFSELSYASSPEDLSRLGKGLGFGRVELISVTAARGATARIDQNVEKVMGDSQVLLAESDRAVIVAFRGTEPEVLRDIVSDLDAFKEALGPNGVQGQVHRGFYQAEGVVHEKVMDWLKTVKGPKPMFVTGHSLGAAMATVFTARYQAAYDRFVNRKQNDPDFEDLWTLPYLQGQYTYGSPRPGDDKFALIFDFLNDKARISDFEVEGGLRIKPASYSARFVSGHDVVTRVPGAQRFAHIHKLKYFADDGTFLEDAAAEKIIVDSVWRMDIEKVKNWITDHMMGNTYLENTYRLANGGQSSGCKH